jgi:Protein of unknown function (DUF2612)
MQDYQRTIISQYAASPIITALIDSMDLWVDPSASIDNWYDEVRNILTAVGYGLDVWGRILGFGRVVAIPGAAKFFGWAEAQPSPTLDTWNHQPWYSGSEITQNYSLSDSLYRFALLAKAATNIWDGSIPGINAILLGLFPFRGPCFVTDGQNMTMTYQFDFPLSAPEFAIVSTPGLLPRPTGVGATVVVP